ncbi:MAG: energy coupling factor transporter S component ThiW [Oscillospiraceae bacterium]|nr:energy coupling factor transporter S component ThiW [Oscillospiraceae bacterium]
MKNSRAFKKSIMLSMFVAIGVVISPILRFEGFAPTAHLVNVVCAVFLGPWYALANAFITAIIRMSVMGIPPLAITGQVFGALLAGILYKLSKGKLFAATLGEVVGTGLIGSIVSYPVMTLFVGRPDLFLFFYTPSFTIASIMGGSIAYILLKILSVNGKLAEIQIELTGKTYEKPKKERGIKSNELPRES